VYCAGFIDETIREKEELYDVLVDLNNRNVSVSNHAKTDFMMSIIHKDVCEFLLNSCEDPNVSDQEVIKGLAVKTKELLAKLEKLKTEHADGNSYIDQKSFSNQKIPAAMERFLYSIANAESMTKM